MTDTSYDNAGRLTADALQLALCLDSFTTLDLAERVGHTVQQGQQKLAEFRRRRSVLTVSRADGPIIDWVLDAVDARLAFLKSLDAAMCGTSPNETPQQEPQQLRCGASGQSTAASNPKSQPDTRESRPGILGFYSGDDQAA